ncbi:MAG: DUF4276 family protein [Candidatus Adiutrix sp.]|nr:DUF4276 family protein [Candidatus Adiutrix sp.]
MHKPNIIIIVEGQSEFSAFRRVLAPYLLRLGLICIFPIIGKTGKIKGGHKDFSILCSMVRNFAAQFPGVYISAFFDYYGINPKWPGVFEGKNQACEPHEKAGLIESAILQSVIEGDCGRLWSGHFFPYIQLHELEALWFADTDIMASILSPKRADIDLKVQFSQIKQQFNGRSEMINDSPGAAPSKRIEQFALYQKGKSAQSQSAPLMEKIGLDKIRQECPRFNQWLTKLESIKHEP